MKRRSKAHFSVATLILGLSMVCAFLLAASTFYGYVRSADIIEQVSADHVQLHIESGQALDELGSLRLEAIVVGTLFIAMMMLSSMWIRARIVPPIQELERYARHAAGRLNEVFEAPAAPPEIRSLMASITTMVETMHSHQRDLEQSVAEQTAAHQDAERYAQRLFDVIPDSIVVVNRDLTIIRANSAAMARWGNIVQTPYINLYGVLFPQGGTTTVEAAIETGRTQHMELLRADPHTQHLYALDTVPIFQRDEVVGAIESIKTVTHFRQAMWARTHQERLVSLGQVAAGVAHEMGNPLASMSSLVQLLQAKRRDEHVEELWSLIRRMEGIIWRTRQLSRRPRQDLAPCDLGAVVAHSLDLLKFDPRWGGVELELELDPNLPSVELVEDALVQIVQNLVSNSLDAVKGRRAAQIRVTVSDRDAGSEVVVEIEDNGPGIPADIQGHVFEPFFTTKPEGTGLGLSLTRDLVVASGGGLELVPSQTGALFRISFPVATDDLNRGQLCESNGGDHVPDPGL